jgi:chemotaxis protein histidine kinase CheA
MAEEQREGREDVRGVIFQFDEHRLLFEFMDGVEEAIGVVPVSGLTLADKAPLDLEVAQLSSYLAAGDELTCSVRKDETLEPFSYTEEVEEEEEAAEGGDGSTTEKSKKVEVKPKWVAEAAVVHSSVKTTAKESAKEEDRKEHVDDDKSVVKDTKDDQVKAIEEGPKVETSSKDEDKDQNSEDKSEEEPSQANGQGQTEKMEVVNGSGQADQNVHDDCQVIEETTTSAKATAAKPNYAASVASVASDAGQEDVVELEVPLEDMEDMFDYEYDGDAQKNSKQPEEFKGEAVDGKEKAAMKPEKALMDDQNSQKKTEKTESSSDRPVKVRVSHLKKPLKGREPVKVTSGVMEVMEGEHKGKFAHFQNGQLSVWGQNLSKANLLYYIRYNDEFSAVIVASPNGTLNLKSASLGEDMKGKTNNQAMLKWFQSRELDFAAFRKWTNDELPKKVYFPLITEVHEGKLETLLKSEGRCDDQH